MVFTYDLGTDRGKVRLLIRDTDASEPIFEDDELNVFLALESSSVKRAAALALETMASNEAYVSKAVKLLDLSTDGPATGKALLERAAKLREQAADEEAQAEGGAFDIAELVYDSFGERERIWKEALRNG